MKKDRLLSLFLPLSLGLLGACGGSNEQAAEAAANTATPADVVTDMTVGAIPAPDAAELAAFKAATRKLYDFKEKAFAEGKADPLVNRFYAENATSVGPEGKPYEGRAAYKANYEKVVAAYNVKVEPIRSYVNGNAGWEWANFHVTPKDPNSKEKPFTFVILFLWTKVDGQWVSAGDAYVVGQFPKN